ncbi:MAG: prolyl oligopeptidase family serine peptidase [Bacteroidia bacterium]|nr:prolyl oligopeptidase family serine peptidase [Bacteroidia bacterium]
MKNLNLFSFAFGTLFFIISCVDNNNNDAKGPRSAILTDTLVSENEHYAITSDTTIILNGDTVDVLFPDGSIKGQILVLPGWNYYRRKCCNESSFCFAALKRGYVLVLPEMGKSLYASAVYPETRKEWADFPQLKWITDTLITYLQKHAGLFSPDQSNYIFGISTGGRGVALIVEHTGTLFKAAAALSGDYDQTKLPTDNLVTGFYGNYTDFKMRWEGEDNPLLNASKVFVPFYLGHGLTDNVVPVEQTRMFYNELKRINTNLSHVLMLKEQYGHSYKYWDSETDAVLKFFEKNR